MHFSEVICESGADLTVDPCTELRYLLEDVSVCKLQWARLA